MDLIRLIPILPGLGAAVNGLFGIRWFSKRTAGAVVTEKGGLLDHLATLAREAGVPAVTGAEGALEALAGAEEATVDAPAWRRWPQ